MTPIHTDRGHVVVLSHARVARDNGAWLTKDRVAETLEGLAGLGWRVSYVAPLSPAQTYLRHQLTDGIDVVPISLDGPLGNRLTTLRHALRVARTADAFLAFMPTVRSALALLCLGPRAIMYAGGAWSDASAPIAWRVRLERLAARRAGTVIVHGEALYDELEPSARRIERCVPMVPAEVGQRLHNGSAPQLRPVDRPLHVLFVGNLSPTKGADAVLEAVLDRPDIRGRLIGPRNDPGLAARLDAVDGDHVRISDYLPWSELREAYEWADVLVLPSRREGFPRVVYEATAFGTALVVSPVGGIPGRLTDGHDALFVPAGDADAVGAAIDALREDPVRARALASEAKRSLSSVFSDPGPALQFDRALQIAARNGRASGWRPGGASEPENVIGPGAGSSA
jgi:glycosyltransferase involved in cell wall biosynthesis